MDSQPNIDFGNVAGSFIKKVISGENAGEAASSLLNKEGERVCFEGAIQRVHNRRWPIFIGTAVAVSGLLVLGSFIKERFR